MEKEAQASKLKILRDYELIYRKYKQNLGRERKILSDKSAKERFDELASTNLPRCIFYVFDIKDDCITFEKNLHLLGYRRKYNRIDIIKSVHKNHQKILPYLLYGLFKILFEEEKYLYEFKNNNIFLSMRRAVKYNVEEGKERFLYLQQFILPFEFDENDKMVSYLNWYIILNDFQGEKMEFEVIAHEYFQAPPKYLNDISTKVKELCSTVLDLLFKNDKQKEIIRLMNNGLSTVEIAEELPLGDNFNSRKKAIDNQKSKILSIAKEEFPLNNFNTVDNVVYFLDRQGFINKEKKYMNY